MEHEAKNPERISVLDHGYVELTGHWGSDEDIIRAARMSTNKGFQGWPQDEKLLRYLYTHRHTTPFEMAGATFEVQAPIFVFRQWHRHRTQSYNEMSGRYTPLPAVDYVPSPEALQRNNSKNKQAGRTVDKEVPGFMAEALSERLAQHFEETQKLYEGLLDCGIPKELARIVLPVARYSRMRASANLLNWMRFMKLRCDLHAQYEIRVFAEAIYEVLRILFPRTMKLFREDPL